MPRLTKLIALALPLAAHAQGRRQNVAVDSARAAQLYVSTRPADLPKADYARQIAEKRKTDSIYAARSAGVMEFRKVTYTSRADGMTIPAYVFAPLQKRGAAGHAALVWVHGGVHGDWGTSMWDPLESTCRHASLSIL